jgi:hypothetical protein
MLGQGHTSFSQQGNLPTEQGNLPTEQGNLPTEQGNLPTEQGNLPTQLEILSSSVSAIAPPADSALTLVRVHPGTGHRFRLLPHHLLGIADKPFDSCQQPACAP